MTRCSIKKTFAIRLSVAVLTLLSSMVVHSLSVNERFKENQSSKAAHRSIKVISQHWGITEKEYSEYLAIMEGKRGTWTPTADPILALGVEAKSEEERRRYAELYVQQEFERQERDKAFVLATIAARERLYPGMLPFGNSTKPQFSAVIDRLALVVEQNCSGCGAALKKYIKVLRKSSAIEALDIYLSDSNGNDEQLRRWVAANNVPTELIRTRRITINHGESNSAIKKIPIVFERQASGQWVEAPL